MNSINPTTNLISNKNIVAIDITGIDGYNYYGYEGKDGSWTVMRELLAQTEYLYAVGSSDITTNFANRTSLTYELPSGFPKA